MAINLPGFLLLVEILLCIFDDLLPKPGSNNAKTERDLLSGRYNFNSIRRRSFVYALCTVSIHMARLDWD